MAFVEVPVLVVFIGRMSANSLEGVQGYWSLARLSMVLLPEIDSPVVSYIGHGELLASSSTGQAIRCNVVLVAIGRPLSQHFFTILQVTQRVLATPGIRLLRHFLCDVGTTLLLRLLLLRTPRR